MSVTQNEYFIELASFSDLARYACALQEYPKRVYSHQFNNSCIISSTLTLANTLLVLYTALPKSGRYVSYKITAKREICDIVDSIKNIANYAPIIHMESDISPLLPAKPDRTTDRFYPLKVKDLGSLARLTYDHEFPDEHNLTLYAFPYGDSWVLGYITSIDMDEVYYNFNYIELSSEPAKNFLKYQGNQGKDPEFLDDFAPGYSYLPIIKIKHEYDIFGFSD